MANITFRSSSWVCGMALGAASLLGATAHAQPAAQGAPIPKSPEFTSPDIKHTIWDWATARPVALARKLRATDPLQRPPFAGAPTDSLKGMAAGIRAVQLDAPARAKAAAYLGTVDCVTYPQAQEMLIATMKEDPSEIVRYEAVMALRHMLTRGCSNMESECKCEKCEMCKFAERDTERHSDRMSDKLIRDAHGKARKEAKQARKDLENERYDCCRGCCNPKALNALSDVAYSKDDQCCWTEPSERVRNAAAVGLCLCQTVSVPVYYGGESVPTELIPIPETNGTGGSKEVDPNKLQEIDPNKKPEVPREQIPGQLPPAPKPELEQPAAFLPLPSQAAAKPIVPGPVAAPVAAPVAVAASPVAKLPEPVAPAPAPATPVQAVPVAEQPVVPIATPVSALSPAPQPATLVALKGYCIVAMKARQFVAAKPEFQSVYEDRLYQFGSAENKVAFDADPETFAPVYAGIDPVEWLKTHKMVEGKFLREFEGRFYMFDSKENWETFKATPQRFVLNDRRSPQNVVTN